MWTEKKATAKSATPGREPKSGRGQEKRTEENTSIGPFNWPTQINKLLPSIHGVHIPPYLLRLSFTVLGTASSPSTIFSFAGQTSPTHKARMDQHLVDTMLNDEQASQRCDVHTGRVELAHDVTPKTPFGSIFLHYCTGGWYYFAWLACSSLNAVALHAKRKPRSMQVESGMSTSTQNKTTQDCNRTGCS